MDDREFRIEVLRRQIQEMETELSQLEQANLQETSSAETPPIPQNPPPLQIPPQLPPQGHLSPSSLYPFSAPPVSHEPRKKKDWETNFGRNILGILASALVFIGVMLLAWASGSKVGQLLGIFVAGVFLTGAGVFGARKKNAYRTSFLSVAGCGAGVLYIGILLAYWYYQLIPALVMYVLFLAWAGLMYLLSRHQPAIFHIIGHVGLLVSIFSQLGDTFDDMALSEVQHVCVQTVILCVYFLVSALFYLLTNRDNTPQKHNVTLILNCICVLALEWKLYLLIGDSRLKLLDGIFQQVITARFCGACVLLLVGFLLFQYFWEMHRWLRLGKASDHVWLLRFLPTLILLFSAFIFLYVCVSISIHHWEKPFVLLVFAAISMGFWIWTQRNRLNTGCYRLAFAASVILAVLCIWLCTPQVRIISWFLFLLGLVLLGKYKKIAFPMQTAYGLFLFASWPLLPSLFPDAVSRDLTLYIYAFFALFNCCMILFCRFVWRSAALRVLTQTGNGIALFLSQLCLPLIPYFSVWQTVLMAVTLTVVYTVNSDQYFQKEREKNLWMGLLFGGKHLVLVSLLLVLFRASSVWMIGGLCVLALGYTLLGFWRQSRGIRLSGWILLLFTMLCLLVGNPPIGMPYAEECIGYFLGAASGFGVLFCYHHFGARMQEKLVKMTKQYLVIPAALLLILGIQMLYRTYLSIWGRIIIVPLFGIMLLAAGWVGMHRKRYRSFFIAVAGTGFAVLFQAIVLCCQSFLEIGTLTIGALFLLWIGAGCYFAQKRPEIFQPLTAVGLFLSVCLFSSAVRENAFVTMSDAQLLGMEQDALFLVLYFVAASVLLTFTIQKESLRYPIIAIFTHTFSLIPLLMVVYAELECSFSGCLMENVWAAIQYGLLLLSVLLQYVGWMLPFRRRQHASDKVWMICYVPTLIQLGILLFFGANNSWAPSQNTAWGHVLCSLPFFVGTVLLMSLWFAAQRRRMPTVIYQVHFSLTVFPAALLLLGVPSEAVQLAPPQAALFQLAAWIILLAVLAWAGLRKHMRFYYQTAYGLLVFGTWIVLMDVSLFAEMSMRQYLSWMVSLFALLNCAVILLQYRNAALRQLYWLSSVCNWIMMICGSFLMLCNWNHRSFAMAMPVKVLLAAVVTVAFFVGSPRLLRKKENGTNTDRELLFGLKHTVWVMVLFCGFEVPGILLSIGFLLLALGFILFGFWKNRKTVRVFGLVLILISVCKLILIDISYERLILRACSFLLCGVLCFAISFIYNRMNAKIGRQ